MYRQDQEVGVPTLSDDRVRVRALRESDIGAYVGAFGEDDDLLNLLGYEGDPEPEGIERWFTEKWVDPPDLRQWEFGIADRETDAFLGTIMIHSCDWKHRRAEIGGWTVPGCRDRGVGSAAFQLVLDWAFDELGLERIEITALPENVSIPHLAEKFGFTYEGTMRKRNFERGRRVDLLLWALLREERPVGRSA
jgi:[ribosomal protein S5]-alanine N-acetyltransferase